MEQLRYATVDFMDHLLIIETSTHNHFFMVFLIKDMATVPTMATIISEATTILGGFLIKGMGILKKPRSMAITISKGQRHKGQKLGLTVVYKMAP